MSETDLSHGPPPLRDIVSGSVEDDVEVHAVDTDAGVVLDSQIDVLLDTEAKVTGLTEIVTSQLVLAHLESPLQDLLGLSSTHRAVHSDLLISSDSKRSHGVAGLGEDRGLPCELLQHLGSTCKSVTRFPHAD